MVVVHGRKFGFLCGGRSELMQEGSAALLASDLPSSSAPGECFDSTALLTQVQ